MSHRSRFLIVLVALVMISGISLIAQTTPSRLNYQGLLTDTNGQPLNNPALVITFRIWDSPTSLEPASLKWEEMQTVQVVDGLFNVILGDIIPIDAEVFSSSNSFLGLQIQGETEAAPRTRLVSVGYSSRVETLDGARGGVISGSIGVAPEEGAGRNELRIELFDDTDSVKFWASENEIFTPCVLYAGDDSRQCTAAFNSGAAQSEDSDISTSVGNSLTSLISHTIQCPMDGFVLVIGSSQFEVSHSGGAASAVICGVSDLAAALPGDQEREWSLAGQLASSVYRNALSTQKIFSVTAGTHTFYLLAKRTSGNNNFAATKKTLSLLFIPKSYGVVSGPKANAVAATTTAPPFPAPSSEIDRLRAEVAELRLMMKSMQSNSGQR